MRNNMRSILIRVLVWAVILSVGLLIGVYVYEKKESKSNPEYSTYSKDPKGAKALFILAQKMGFESQRHTRPARLLPQGVTQIVIRPDLFRFNDDMERKYLKKWMEDGNTMVVMDDTSGIDQYNLHGFTQEKPQEIEGKTKGSLYSVGEGALYVLHDTSGFANGANYYSNEGLKKVEPGVDLIHMLESIGNQRVVFNEYYHGINTGEVSVWDLVGSRGKLVFVQGMLALLVFLYIKSRRFGKPVTVFEITKRKENERLFALSNIYIKASANSLVLETYLNNMKKELSGFLGFHKVPPYEELVQAASSHKFLDDLGFARVLAASEAYVREEKSGKDDLVNLVNQIEMIRKGIQ